MEDEAVVIALEPEEGEEGEMSDEKMIEECSKELLSAIESKDSKKVADALKTFIQLC